MNRRFQFGWRALLIAFTTPTNHAPRYVIKWRHRRPQFTLRALLAAVFLVSLGAAAAHYHHRAEIQRITAELERMKRQVSTYRRVYIEGPGHEEAIREAEERIRTAEKHLKELMGR